MQSCRVARGKCRHLTRSCMHHMVLYSQGLGSPRIMLRVETRSRIIKSSDEDGKGVLQARYQVQEHKRVCTEC